MNTSPLNLWTPVVLGSILLQKEGRNLLPLPWQNKVPGNTGASTDYVCSPAGDEKQTGCLFRLSP